MTRLLDFWVCSLPTLPTEQFWFISVTAECRVVSVCLSVCMTQLHNCRNTQLHNCRTTQLQNYTTAKLHNCRTAELHHCRTTQLHNCRTTQLHNCRRNYRKPDTQFCSISCDALGRVLIIAKSDCQLCHVCLSVCPHGTTPLPLDGFLWNLIWEYFWKHVWKNFFFLNLTRMALRYFTWRPVYLCDNISPNCSYSEKWFRQKL
jgi:hypothetical protein